jgi:prepilin-type N-terminal cleavage/methylation domain-containing protein/prepilin-type processing-associated H-X9-DG protein
LYQFDSHNPSRHCVAIPRRRGGFTLIELLVVVAIIAVLIALLFPAIRGTVGAARSFRCQSSQRTIAFDFGVFADDQLHGSRGNDESGLGRGQFRVETFQNSQYGVNEFWAYDNVPVYRVPDTKGRDPMRCAEIRGPLDLYRLNSCVNGGVRPSENVSYGFNIRLHWSDYFAAANRPYSVTLTSRILEGYGVVATSSIPLLMDVDGAAASAAGRSPLFTGPTAGALSELYANDALWWPGSRHGGAMNIAFIDGHVVTTKRPLGEASIAWDFEPPQPPR